MRKRGFTVAEIQVAFFISFIMFLAAFSLYIFYHKTYAVGNAILDVYANSRIASALMSGDIRDAAQIESSFTSGGATYTTSDSCIVMKVPSIDSAGAVIPDQYDEFIYLLQASDLLRIIIPYTAGSTPSARASENRAVARDCASLTFSSGGVTLSQISPSALSDINTVGIRLPINKAILSLSGAEMVTESITPTTIIRMRNK